MNKRLIIITSAIIVIIVAFVGIGNSGLFGGSQNQPINLTGIEITQYQGQQLSPISDLRDVSISGTQHVDINSYTLSVTGLVYNPQNYTYDKVIDDHQLYMKVVTLNCVEGWEAKILWEGVLLKDLIMEAGPLPSANTVVFHCYDGYTTSLPLDYIISNNIILANKADNVTLTPAMGFPFQVVAESKWGYKWAKWVTSIELTDDPNYKGYWESRGYTTSGDLNNSFFGP